jgi:hypothetical protein
MAKRCQTINSIPKQNLNGVENDCPFQLTVLSEEDESPEKEEIVNKVDKKLTAMKRPPLVPKPV